MPQGGERFSNPGPYSSLMVKYMNKLLWIGSPFFSSSLAQFGWDVVVHNFEEPYFYT